MLGIVFVFERFRRRYFGLGAGRQVKELKETLNSVQSFIFGPYTLQPPRGCQVIATKKYAAFLPKNGLKPHISV